MFRFDYFSCGKWDDGIYKFYDFTWRHSRLCYRIFYSDICDYSIRKRKNKKETQINSGSANRKNTGETVMGIKIVSAYDRAEEVRRLFEEYTDMLVENVPFLHCNSGYPGIPGRKDHFQDRKSVV